ncbi:MAG: histidine phosphatase family protein, partial [Elusimicrobia bacterium]|nr:histidine phosphatase family protein [Elusimicrobiota bacterium]
MTWILARHGNTFENGRPVTMTGGYQDLALTGEGKSQAKIFGKMLQKRRWKPAAVYCSPLARTKDFAQVALHEAGWEASVIVEEVLREIDYGAWTGKTDDEIKREFGRRSWEAWQERSQWPLAAQWKPGEKKLIASIYDFSERLLAVHKTRQNVLIVSSSGVLR